MRLSLSTMISSPDALAQDCWGFGALGIVRLVFTTDETAVTLCEDVHLTRFATCSSDGFILLFVPGERNISASTSRSPSESSYFLSAVLPLEPSGNFEVILCSAECSPKLFRDINIKRPSVRQREKCWCQRHAGDWHYLCHAATASKYSTVNQLKTRCYLKAPSVFVQCLSPLPEDHFQSYICFQLQRK